MRHGQSEGNQKRIIQGRTNDYGLTKEGKKEIETIAKENRDELKDIEIIISSPAKRAIETSEIINSQINKSIKIDPNIQEFNPGILAGNTHEYNQTVYPEYYRVWKERQDLDEIPGAEKGKELQARVLAFLMQYVEKENFSDLIVSHAGFIRCLVNTIEGRTRTTPIDIKNGVVYILEDPMSNLKINKRKRAMASKVYIIETVDGKYVAKIKDRNIIQEDIKEKELLDKMENKLGKLPHVLSLSNYPDGSIKVLEYVEGEHIYGELNSEQESALTKKVRKMHYFLKEMDTTGYEKENLMDMIQKSNEIAKNKYVKQISREILGDEKNIKKLNNSEYCLVHNDLNRDNVLFEQENGNIEVNIIDWEGIGLFPKEYQLASYLASCILIEGSNMDEVMRIAHQFETDVDEKYITFLMKIRLFTGLFYFAENKNIYTQMNEDVARSILKKYFFASEKLNNYIENNKKDNILEESR